MLELVEKRTRTGKTHSLGSNKFAVDVSVGSVHYQDNGWQEIGNEFTPAVAPWNWQMLKDGYHVRVKEDFTAGQILEFEKRDETVQFQPMALEWTNDLDQIESISMPDDVIPVVSNPAVDLLPRVGVLSHNGTIRWNGAYGPGIDFTWFCSQSRLVKLLEIDQLANLPAPQQYIMDGGNPVLRLNLIFDPSDLEIFVDGQEWNKRTKVTTFNTIEFRKDGETLWGFAPLLFWDSTYINRGQSVATIEKRSNKLYISIRVPYDWLQTAVYPVYVDVDVNEQVGATNDDAYETGAGATTTNSVLALSTHTSPASSGYICSGARYQTVDVPNAATIITAYQELWMYHATLNDAEADIYGNDVDSGVDFSTDPDIIHTRARTAASASWSEADITQDTWAGSSVEIKTVIKEIVDRGGWAADNNLVLLTIAKTAVDNIDCYFLGWDSDSSKAPKLHVEYEVAAAGHPTMKRWGGVPFMEPRGRGVW